MKQIVMILSLLLSTLGLQAKGKALIDQVEPAFWFCGMKQPSLQLMVYGAGIRDAQVALDSYAGVHLQQVVPLESPNYLLVYLQVEPSAQPGTLRLTFSLGKRKQVVNYELRQRDRRPETRTSFTAHDVLYMLMPDRFSSGRDVAASQKGLHPYKVDRSEPSLRHGGDLEGIRQHLDYFNELGVTALWVTPVLENNSPDRDRQSTYHGYATTNYYRVDPRFGTNAEYRQLIDECHQHGLKFVMDMIFNHTGYEHPWNLDRPSGDWFNVPHDRSYQQTSYKLTPVLDPYASDVDRSETVDGWFVPTMPDLNQRNPHVMRYLIQNSKWWIETAGIDGIRMDTYPYADRRAMADWMEELLQEYPHFNVVGETWVTEPAYTSTWQTGSPNSTIDSHLPTVMDFAFFDRLTQAAGEETDAWWEGLNRIYNSFVYDYLYPDPTHVMAFIENHDTDRFLKNGHDVPMLKQALTLLLTTRRIPQLYYGTEILMGGTKEVTDGNVRKDFPGGWAGDARNAFSKDGRTREEQQMFAWLSRLLHWRRDSKAVTEGSMKHFCPVNGCYVYARQQADETVLVILNGTTKTATLPLARFAEVIGNCRQATDVTTGRSVSLTGTLELAPRESLVLPLQ
ncbi:MAG: glycoside hydrolase family 13 protein [Bacteroidaceae bacterium]|nr:glycoside hydrolase family 13 protein [Bacteroidaceae bacterium]